MGHEVTAVVGPAIGKLVFVRPGAPGAEGMGQCSEKGQQYLVGSDTGERSQQGGVGWTEEEPIPAEVTWSQCSSLMRVGSGQQLA